MASAAELGISEQEFQDAMNLEKVYSLLSKHSSRCSKCSSSATHVDCSTYQWLCASHAVGRKNCKRIGDDRFTSSEVEKLDKKYGGGSHGGVGSPHDVRSPRIVRSSKVDRSRKGRKSRHLGRHNRKHHSPSSDEESQADSDDSDDDYPPVKTSRSKSSKPNKTKNSFAAFDEDFSHVGSPRAATFQSSPAEMPGMAGLLHQQSQYGQTFMNPQSAFGTPMNSVDPIGQVGFGGYGPGLGPQGGPQMQLGMNQQRPFMGSRMASRGNYDPQTGHMGTFGIQHHSVMFGGPQRPTACHMYGENPFGRAQMPMYGTFSSPFQAGQARAQFGGQTGSYSQRSIPGNAFGNQGYSQLQQRLNPFLSMGNIGGSQRPFYPSVGLQTPSMGANAGMGFGNQSNPFNQGNQMQRSYSHPHMFNSVSSIPNVSADQSDWWD